MSEIWNEFEKIAVAQGLVEAQEDFGEYQERPQEDVTKMPDRYDSLSDDAIRLLYNLKPETILDPNKTIIENAHPETAVVGRAYDAMNAVIENEHQRHDMMAYIALKQPSGHIIHRRYVAAKQDLVNALTRAAFALDSKDEMELMSFADNCTERLVEGKPRVKTALLGWGWVIGWAVLSGAIYYLFGSGTSAQNVYANSKKVLEELDDLYDKPYTNGIRTDVTKLMEYAQEVHAMKGPLGSVRSIDDVKTVAKSEKYTKEIQGIKARLQKYIQQLSAVQRAIPDWVNRIKLDNSSSTEESSDFWHKIKNVGDFLWKDDVEDLIDALTGSGTLEVKIHSGGLYEAISNEISSISKAIASANVDINKYLNGPANLPEPEIAPESAPESVGLARTRSDYVPPEM